MAPNIAVFSLMVYKSTTPIIVSKKAMDKAEFEVILLEGTGRFLVRSIKTSNSFSITWLNAFEAPTMQYPPIASFNKTIQSKE